MKYFQILPLKKKFKSSNGFTLLELMIVSGVVVVVLVGLMATYVTALELSETSKNTNLAMAQARQVAESMRSIAFTSVPGTYSGHTFQVSGMAVNSGLGYVSIDNSNPSLLNVTIGVCWRQKNDRIIGECSLNGSSLVFNDSNADGILDSPVQITTLITQR